MIQQAGLQYPANETTDSSRRLGLIALAVAAGTFFLVTVSFTVELAAGAVGLIESAYIDPIVLYAVASIVYIASVIIGGLAIKQEASKVAPGLAIGVAVVGLVNSLSFGLMILMYS